MNKKLLSTLLGAEFFTSAAGFAAVPQSQSAVVGIESGVNISQVEKTFGQPDKSANNSDAYGKNFVYLQV